MFEGSQKASHETGHMVDEGLRAHMGKVYNLMSLGTAISFVSALAFGKVDSLNSIIYRASEDSVTMTGFGWIMMFAPLVLIFGMFGMVRYAPAAAVTAFYYFFTAVLGVSLSSIFMTYTDGSILQVFLLTSGAFAGLSLWGYTTKKDISGWGSFLFMGLFALIGASILNIFLGSSAMDFALAVAGVLIFAGLTAYDTQKIKTDYLQNAGHMDKEALHKSAILAALDLYLDFINLLLELLRFFGQKK